MAQSRRLFLPQTNVPCVPGSGPQPLDPEETHYARDVLRLGDGDSVVLLDGQGKTAEAILHLEGRRGPGHVSLQLPWTAHPSLARGIALSLLVPLPKGDRADWMVEKLAELGCFEVVFITCARSVHSREKQATKRLERLERVARAAARQARHGRIPKLTSTAEVPLADALATHAPDPGPQNPRLAWVADLGPKLVPWLQALAAAYTQAQASCHHALLLGPEGGLTPDELNQARAFGYTPVGLGPHVLRVETAAVAAAVVASQTAP